MAIPKRFARSAGTLLGNGPVPTADEQGCHRIDARIEARGDAAFDAPHVGIGDAQILFAREQQRYIDRNTGKYRRLDGGNAGGRSRNLDVKIGAVRLLVNTQRRVDGALGFVRQQRRNFHGDPAVDSLSAVELRTENIGGAAQILQRQFHEQIFARHTGLRLLTNALVVRRGLADGLIEYRRVRGETGDRELLHIAAQGAVVENFPRNVVEPETLAQIMQVFRVAHGRTLKSVKERFIKIRDSLDRRDPAPASPLRTPAPMRNGLGARTPSSAWSQASISSRPKDWACRRP